ncbi:hypothetical protein CEXT_179041 [Caerostris extrusa]|uniref:Uncharacterized protein n=1 Tax=Caerostris extrusa TaxID=172846 RepID=A0AAV4RWQ3_CAEEX|nr:hypothetical protein CEXT_179041 [Caerostris extrusa]
MKGQRLHRSSVQVITRAGRRLPLIARDCPLCVLGATSDGLVAFKSDRTHACETGSIVGNGGHSTGVNSHTLLPQFGRDMGQIMKVNLGAEQGSEPDSGPQNAWAETGRYWSQGAMKYGSLGTSRPPKGRTGSRQFSREGI